MKHGFRLFWYIIKKCQAEKIFSGFIASILIVGLILLKIEPNINTYGDSIWYIFVASTSIGFGDLVVTTTLGRILTVYITIYEIAIVAVFSGVIVSHYMEVINRREKMTATVFMDKLEHISELSKEELLEIQNTVKKLKG